MSTSTLQVLVLGPAAFSLDGRDVDLGTEKHRALLAYLSVEPTRVHPRAHLAALLWPEASDDRSKQSLRQALYRIRQGLDKASDQQSPRKFLAVTRPSVGFVEPTAIDCDVVEFQSLIEQTQHHDRAGLANCPTCIARLRRACDLYRGELLAGFSSDYSTTFDEWVLLQRERLQNLALTALERLVGAYQANEAHDDAIHIAFRSLSIDPYREQSHSDLMTVLAAHGLPDRAIGHFEQFEAMLREEIGLEPSPETRQLAEQIRSKAAQRTEVRPSSANSDSTGPTIANGAEPGRRPRDPGMLPAGSVLPFHRNIAFAERDTELLQLAEALVPRDSDATFRARSFAITGPQGAGKTQLAVEFAYRYGTTFQGGVYLIDCTDPSEVRAHAAELGNENGLQLFSDSSDLTQDERLQLVQAALHDGEASLLILDGCDVETASAWAQWCTTTSMLVTSRTTTLPHELRLTPLAETEPERRGNILVVDDTAANLAILCSILEAEGYEARPAINGQVALTAVERSVPDLILLDVMMPGLSGFDVCDALKRDPRYHDIPVIFISALTDTPDKLTAFQAGGVDYITKPFQPDEVLARVGLHIRLHSVASNLRRPRNYGSHSSSRGDSQND